MLDGELHQWLPDIEESLAVGDFTVVKNIRSEQIGPDICAELDTDTGALTLVDTDYGVEVPARGVLRLAQFISEHSAIIALRIEKGSE